MLYERIVTRRTSLRPPKHGGPNTKERVSVKPDPRMRSIQRRTGRSGLTRAPPNCLAGPALLWRAQSNPPQHARARPPALLALSLSGQRHEDSARFGGRGASDASECILGRSSDWAWIGVGMPMPGVCICCSERGKRRSSQRDSTGHFKPGPAGERPPEWTAADRRPPFYL